MTIVPRTVGAVGGAIMTGGTAAAQGIAMLNPQRWGGSTAASSGYSRDLERDGRALFEHGGEGDRGTHRPGVCRLVFGRKVSHNSS